MDNNQQSILKDLLLEIEDTDNQSRKLIEQKIMDKKDDNPSEYMVSLVNWLSDLDTNLKTRTTALNFLK